VLADIERAGVLVDEGNLKSITGQLRDDIITLEKENMLWPEWNLIYLLQNS